jgi:REP element-mobilizing transposase RayT
MYNSIQHFYEFGIKEIEKEIKSFIRERKDIADLVLDLRENLYKLGRDILTEVLEDMDEYLRNSGVRKNSWEVVRKDEASLLTSIGMIKYNRTYFKSKKDGKRQYLVDRIAGIEPHDRISADVVINAIDEAADSSYRKAGKKAAYLDEISKQAVMDKVHNLDIAESKIKKCERKNIRILYIEADEDHVHLQNEKNIDRDGTVHNIAMPKLVYVHEGIDLDKSSKKRKVLKNPHYFGGIYKNSEDLWLEVEEYIDNQYNMDSVETIYLSGDGAPWIRQGLNWIPKSRFVLDSYHMKKYINVATAHLNDELIKQELKDAIDWPDKECVKKVFKKIIERTDSDTKIMAVKKARRYILNNWDGIEIKADKWTELIGCSAEGHVSHIFSDRLSSRPKGWSKVGVAQMSKLLIYRKNGGKVYDLVMAQKTKKSKEKKQQIQDELIKDLRNSSNRYSVSWSSSLPAVTRGEKTGLYNELRSIIGMCS